jgi:energy-converting hydrogenase Eha subunit G
LARLVTTDIVSVWYLTVTAPAARHTYMAVVLERLVLCKILLCDVQAISAILYIRMYNYEKTNRYLSSVVSDPVHNWIFNVEKTSHTFDHLSKIPFSTQISAY